MHCTARHKTCERLDTWQPKNMSDACPCFCADVVDVDILCKILEHAYDSWRQLKHARVHAISKAFRAAVDLCAQSPTFPEFPTFRRTTFVDHCRVPGHRGVNISSVPLSYTSAMQHEWTFELLSVTRNQCLWKIGVCVTETPVAYPHWPDSFVLMADIGGGATAQHFEEVADVEPGATASHQPSLSNSNCIHVPSSTSECRLRRQSWYEGVYNLRRCLAQSFPEEYLLDEPDHELEVLVRPEPHPEATLRRTVYRRSGAREVYEECASQTSSTSMHRYGQLIPWAGSGSVTFQYSQRVSMLTIRFGVDIDSIHSQRPRVYRMKLPSSVEGRANGLPEITFRCDDQLIKLLEDVSAIPRW